MLSYRLEKRIGKVKSNGIAKLTGYKFIFEKHSKDGSSKANIHYTGDVDNYVLGVIYEIDEHKKEALDEFEGLGHGYESNILKVIQGEEGEIEVYTYVATDVIDDNPYDWYKDLILEGARENNLPLEYISAIEMMPDKEDDVEARASTAKWVLKENKMDRKLLRSSIDAINEMNKTQQFTITLPGQAFDQRVITIEKAEMGFTFETTTKIIKGVQTHQELDVNGEHLVLVGDDNTLFLSGKNLLVNNIQYDDEAFTKILKGTINAVSTLPQEDFVNKYLRLIMPITKRLRLENDYQCQPFTLDYKLRRGFLGIVIHDISFDFYTTKEGDIEYLVIDASQPMDIRDFQISCNSILLNYALLSSDYHSSEAYFCAFTEAELETPVGVLYHELGGSVLELFGLFTTNPYVGQTIAMLHRDANGTIDDPIIEEYKRELNYFPLEVFSKMCQLTVSDDKILRTLIFLINNNKILEIKLPNQYVALETITASLASGNKELKPIENPRLASQLTERLKRTVDEFVKEHEFKSEELERLNPLIRKIETLNAPPNADKLSKLFKILGYDLNKEENRIIKLRNSFLHGGTVTLGFEEDDFKEHFYMSLRLHFLLGVLILKHAGYSGLLKNLPKLYEYITGKLIDEPTFKRV